MKKTSVTIFGILTLIIPALFWRMPLIAGALLAVLHAAILVYLRKKAIWKLYAGGFVFGPLSEALLIHFGAWSYTLPQVAGIPLWLPFVWGGATLVISLVAIRETSSAL